MISRVIHYAVIRYRPAPELSEFANIGIVAYDPDRGAVSFKLAPRRFRRVTQFFDNIDPHTYSEVVKLIEEELTKLSDLSRIRTSDVIRHLFVAFVRKREGLVTFSDVRAVVASQKEDVAKTLYNRFVRRTAEPLPQRELKMVRDIRGRLHEANIFDFKARQIEDDLMPLRLPLVSDRRERAAIKPIAFEQKTTLGVLDHANLWHDRFRHLLDREIFQPRNVMIAIELPPLTSDVLMLEAFDLAYNRVSALGVATARYDPDAGTPLELVEFALRSAGTQRPLLN